MPLPDCDASMPASTLKTPVLEPSSKSPPRRHAPGRFENGLPGPPTQLWSLPKPAGQLVQCCAKSPHSATRSHSFPTMSNAPQLDLQFARLPVFVCAWDFVLQSLAPGVLPGSGVPAAASCHSSFRARRFPESRHAWLARKKVTQPLGSTPEIDTAYTPGLGGFDPETGVHWPFGGKLVGKPGAAQTWGPAGLNCVAPPFWRSVSVAVPACTLLTSVVFEGSICHTLASYLSTQVGPTFTESGGHAATTIVVVVLLVVVVVVGGFVVVVVEMLVVVVVGGRVVVMVEDVTEVVVEP